MNGYKAIQAAAAARGVSVRRVLISSGKAESFLSKAVNRGSSPTTDTAAQLLGACEYVLAAVPAEDVPPTAIVID